MFKSLRREQLSEEVRVIIRRANQWDDDLLRLDHIADKEVPARDMLRPVMVLGIIG